MVVVSGPLQVRGAETRKVEKEIDWTIYRAEVYGSATEVESGESFAGGGWMSEAEVPHLTSRVARSTPRQQHSVPEKVTLRFLETDRKIQTPAIRSKGIPIPSPTP